MVVGLGNPGPEYEKTRHNVGKRFVFYLHRFFPQGSCHQRTWGKYSVVLWENQKVFLATLSTYMNQSGKAIRSALEELQVELPSLFIAHDELDLPFGVVRLKEGGSPAGHRGLISIYDALGGEKDFKRIRFGIGRPPERQREEIVRYVLSPFTLEEENRLEELFLFARKALDLSFKEGFLRAQSWLHSQKVTISDQA
jgi:PTH1 family peptidyl-tRNA hydrolase